MIFFLIGDLQIAFFFFSLDTDMVTIIYQSFLNMYHLQFNAPLTFPTQQIFKEKIKTTNNLLTAKQNIKWKKNSSLLLFEWFIIFIFFLRWQHFFLYNNKENIINKKKTMYVNKLASNSAMKIFFYISNALFIFYYDYKKWCIFLRKLKNITP